MKLRRKFEIGSPNHNEKSRKRLGGLNNSQTTIKAIAHPLPFSIFTDTGQLLS